MVSNTIQERAIAMPTTKRLTKQEREWRSEDDARTLANAKVIVNDPARLVGAKGAAARMAEDDKKEASALDDVAKLKPNAPLKDVVADKKPVRRKPKPNPNPHNVFKRL